MGDATGAYLVFTAAPTALPPIKNQKLKTQKSPHRPDWSLVIAPQIGNRQSEIGNPRPRTLSPCHPFTLSSAPPPPTQNRQPIKNQTFPLPNTPPQGKILPRHPGGNHAPPSLSKFNQPRHPGQLPARTLRIPIAGPRGGGMQPVAPVPTHAQPGAPISAKPLENPDESSQAHHHAPLLNSSARTSQVHPAAPLRFRHSSSGHLDLIRHSSFEFRHLIAAPPRRASSRLRTSNPELGNLPPSAPLPTLQSKIENRKSKIPHPHPVPPSPPHPPPPANPLSPLQSPRLHPRL